MHAFTRSLTIQAAPRDVFHALTDLDQHPEYMPTVVHLEPLTDPPVQVGSQWRETRRFRLFGFIPLRGSAIIEVAEHDRPKALTLVSNDGCNHAAYRFSLERAGRKATKVTWTAECMGVGKYDGNEKVARRLARMVEKHDGDLLERLAAHLEPDRGQAIAASTVQ